MQFVGILFWWYGAGLVAQLKAIGGLMMKYFDFFSIDLLIKTLFAPFRQISAGKVKGSIGMQLRAWFDRLISRVIGAIVRTLTMIAGLIVLALVAIIGAVYLCLWITAPAWPVVGLTLMLTGWIPWIK